MASDSSGNFKSIILWAIAVTFILGSLAGVGVGLSLWREWLAHGRHVANLSVGAFTVADIARPANPESEGAGGKCPQERPVKIAIRNDSSRTMRAATLKMQALMRGPPADIPPSTAFATLDVTIEPGQTTEGCWAFVPPEPGHSAARYVVTVEEARFE